MGLDVTLIPTWQADPPWRKRLDASGCRTIESHPDRLSQVPNLAGSVVVSMCNSRFLIVADRFRQLGCRIVWLGCMNWLFSAERLHYRLHGTFDRYVFQSRHQHDQLVPQLRHYGYQDTQGRIIRGAFDLEEFPFTPREHREGEAFHVGRISRAKADKFSPRTWKIYERIPHPVRATVLGWADEVEAQLGPPPHWAECLPPGNRPTAEVLATLHALVHTGGTAVENWPRVGLEAMAAGVPVIAENRGGWREMIRHGQTGYLCDNDEEFAYYAARLAYDETHRQQMAYQARRAAEEELAPRDTIATAWRELLDELEKQPL